MPLSEYWLLLIALLTSTFAAVFGMGGGVPLITLMPGFVPPVAIIPLHAVTQLASNVSRMAFGWKHVDLSLVAPFMLGAIAGVLVGGRLFLSLNLDWLPAIMGVVILAITWIPLPKVQGEGNWPLVLLGFCTGSYMPRRPSEPFGEPPSFSTSQTSSKRAMWPKSHRVGLMSGSCWTR